MKSLRIVGLVLGVAFGCLVLLLVFEVYYWLCWKKRTRQRHRDLEMDSNITGKPLFQIFCEERPYEDDTERQVQTQCSRFFLSTIEEGTKEGSECESVNKSNTGRISLSESSSFVGSPYFTPVASTSPFFTPPIDLNLPVSTHLESASEDAGLNRVKLSTPPPRFNKFLQHTGETHKEVAREAR